MKTEKMTQFERVTQALATGDEGFYICNEDNGREVEVTNMAGGRYLCKDANGEPCRQVDDEAFAYNFLMGRGPIGPRLTT